MTMTIISQSHLPCIPYGCDEFGRLEHVMMHPPGDSLKLVNEENRKNWHFEKVPDAAKYNEEHERYRKLLESRGVIVHFLSDHVTKYRELMNKLPNLTFLHGREIAFEADRPFAAYADGDPLAGLPVTIRVMPRALKVLVP